MILISLSINGLVIMLCGCGQTRLVCCGYTSSDPSASPQWGNRSSTWEYSTAEHQSDTYSSGTSQGLYQRLGGQFKASCDPRKSPSLASNPDEAHRTNPANTTTTTYQEPVPQDSSQRKHYCTVSRMACLRRLSSTAAMSWAVSGQAMNRPRRRRRRAVVLEPSILKCGQISADSRWRSLIFRGSQLWGMQISQCFHRQARLVDTSPRMQSDSFPGTC